MTRLLVTFLLAFLFSLVAASHVEHHYAPQARKAPEPVRPLWQQVSERK